MYNNKQQRDKMVSWASSQSGMLVHVSPAL